MKSTAGPLLLGIDGGGTSTDLCITDASERTLATRRIGATNLVSQGVRPTIEMLETALLGLLASIGASPDSIGAAVLGFAGAGRNAERAPLERWVASTLPGARRMVVSDADLVLAAGTPARTGLAVIAGTGSAVLARNAAGHVLVVGGWGPGIGDPGSAHAVGRAALRCVADQADRVGPTTLLTEIILQSLEVDSARDLPIFVTSSASVAGLAKLVSSAADRGDPAAERILDEAGRDLASQAATATRQLEWGAPPVSCAIGGAVLVHAHRVRASFLAEVGRREPRLAPITVVERPVAGAIAMARELATGARS